MYILVSAILVMCILNFITNLNIIAGRNSRTRLRVKRTYIAEPNYLDWYENWLNEQHNQEIKAIVDEIANCA